MAFDDEVRELRQRISTLQARRARAQVEYENANTRKAEANEILKKEGVESAEDAKRILVKLQEDLDAEMAAAEKALSEAGA